MGRKSRQAIANKRKVEQQPRILDARRRKAASSSEVCDVQRGGDRVQCAGAAARRRRSRAHRPTAHAAGGVGAEPRVGAHVCPGGRDARPVGRSHLSRTEHLERGFPYKL